MSLKLKLILIIAFEVAVTVGFAGFLMYRESKGELKRLARALLVAQTEKAYDLCEFHSRTASEPSEDLKQKIAQVEIAGQGYISVLSNEASRRGVLVVHPTDVGKSLYNDEFPHIMEIHDEIDENGKTDGYSDFTYYEQGTKARGRQGESKIGYFKYFAPWDWVILATGYEKDVFASRDQLRATLFPMVLGLIGLGAVLVYITIGQMFKPVQRLTESTREVAKGNWDISIDHKSKDEIGILAQSFDHMVNSLRENARMWHEFNVARDMQAQMLPDSFPQIKGVNLSAKSIPTTEVGGDFYDFLPLEDGRLGVVVGDVSGHGVSAAMVMTAAMSAVRFAAEEKETTDAVLTMVNNRLKKDIQNHMFVALFYGIYDPEQRKLFYTNAGQTMPFILRDDEAKFIPQAKSSDCFPLGIVHAPRYEQLSIDLQPGDVLVFYTDGIVDAMNGSYENYGFDRFSESIKANASLPPDQTIDRLIGDMHQYCGENNSLDDVTVVILKVE